MYSEAGPVAPAGGGVGGTCGRARAAGYDHPAGPVGPMLGPPCHIPPLSSQTAVQTAKRRHFSQITVKLVKMTKCRPNILKRPVIVPISKTGSESRLLIFWDFRFAQPSLPRNYWAYFDHTAEFSVKTAKCHQYVHAKGSSDTPTGPRSKLPLWTRSSSDSARAELVPFLGILNEVVYY